MTDVDRLQDMVIALEVRLTVAEADADRLASAVRHLLTQGDMSDARARWLGQHLVLHAEAVELRGG